MSLAGRWARQRAIATALALVVVALGCAPLVSAALRGVDPAQAATYSAAEAAGTFQCLDGSKQVPASALNDNYCDCPDGSDEPGTSACTTGTFYCRNRGHQPLVLNSSFVDDRICDCCDGSDEAPGSCTNTCIEKGAAAREALRQAAKDAGAGNKIWRQRIRDAVTTKAQWRSTVEALKKEEAALQPEVDKLQTAKSAAEEKEKAVRERKEKADAARKEAEDKRRAAKEKAAAAKKAAEDAKQAAAKAAKLAQQQPLPQHTGASGTGGDGNEDAPRMQSPEEAAGGTGAISFDTSAEALRKANEAMQKALGKTAQEALAEAEDKQAATDAAAAQATAEKHAADGTDAKEAADAGAKAAELGAGASGSGHVQVDSSPDALAAATKAMQEALAKQGTTLEQLQAKAAGKVEVIPAAAEQNQKSDEELAQERMSQWVKSNDAAAAAVDEVAAAGEAVEDEGAEGEEAAEEAVEGEVPAEEEAEVDEEELAEEEALAAEEAEQAAAGGQITELGGPLGKGISWLKGLFTPKPVETAELERLEAAAAKARDAWSGKNDRLSTLHRELRDLEDKLARDYGPDDAFLALEGQCFTATAEKYTYDVCPYGGAAQKEGSSSTSLGSFQRFEEDNSAMLFESGAACWSGPARSIKVELSCGAKEVLSSISEPSRCVYAAKLATPSLCTKALQDRWQAEADAAQAELDSIGKDEL